MILSNEPYFSRNSFWEVLVIDDSKLNRAIVRNTLSQLNIRITEASDGLDGLEQLKKKNFDLILVDIIMPNLDGFGFLERYQEFLASDDFIPVILMTGSDDLNSKIKGLNIGADDFLLKPLNEKELTARVRSLLRLKKAHTELFEKNQIIKKELESAQRIQQFIIPKDFSRIEYPRISARYLPIEDIGGDFFDYYRLPNGNLGFLIADVTGHGIPAALVMTMAKMIFSVYSPYFTSTGKIFHTVNNELIGLLLDHQYITAFYIIYDRDGNRISFTNAGHTRTQYYRHKTGNILALDTNGLFIGIKNNGEYGEKSLSVEPGDRLLMYTDGITELKNQSREEYGESRLASFLKCHHELHGDEFCDALLDDLRSFAILERRSDDIAFLNIEF